VHRSQARASSQQRFKRHIHHTGKDSNLEELKTNLRPRKKSDFVDDNSDSRVSSGKTTVSLKKMAYMTERNIHKLDAEIGSLKAEIEAAAMSQTREIMNDIAQRLAI